MGNLSSKLGINKGKKVDTIPGYSLHAQNESPGESGYGTSDRDPSGYGTYRPVDESLQTVQQSVPSEKKKSKDRGLDPANTF